VSLEFLINISLPAAL